MAKFSLKTIPENRSVVLGDYLVVTVSLQIEKIVEIGGF